MNDEVNVVETEEKEEKAPKVEIIRGRMPLPLVRTMKFCHADLNDSQVADMYRTTSGKVSDVRKSRNFGYIDENVVAFNQDQIDAANARIEELGDGAEAVKEAMESAGIRVATDEEQAAFDEARASTRKPRGAAKAEPEVTGEVSHEEQAEKLQEEEDAGEAPSDDLDNLLG